MSNPIKPTVGRMVYYVAYGTPGGEYKAGAERAATITQVNDDGSVGLCIFNPSGLFFNPSIPYDDSESPKAGTWHWMPYQLGQAKANA